MADTVAPNISFEGLLLAVLSIKMKGQGGGGGFPPKKLGGVGGGSPKIFPPF